MHHGDQGHLRITGHLAAKAAVRWAVRFSMRLALRAFGSLPFGSPALPLSLAVGGFAFGLRILGPQQSRMHVELAAVIEAMMQPPIAPSAWR